MNKKGLELGLYPVLFCSEEGEGYNVLGTGGFGETGVRTRQVLMLTKKVIWLPLMEKKKRRVVPVKMAVFEHLLCLDRSKVYPVDCERRQWSTAV